MNIRYPIYEGVYRILTIDRDPSCHCAGNICTHVREQCVGGAYGEVPGYH